MDRKMGKATFFIGVYPMSPSQENTWAVGQDMPKEIVQCHSCRVSR